MVENTTQRRRGRPPGPIKEQRNVNLTVRLTHETKQELERAAAANGRSLSAESELRLSQSVLSDGTLQQAFDLAFGHQAAGLVLLIGRVMQEVGSHAGFTVTHTLEGSKNWLEVPYAVDQATTAVNDLLRAIRPAGVVIAPRMGKAGDLDIDAVYENLGASFALTWLHAIAGDAPTAFLARSAEEIRWRLGTEVTARIRANLPSGSQSPRDAVPEPLSQPEHPPLMKVVE